jgi:hypothetical protein
MLLTNYFLPPKYITIIRIHYNAFNIVDLGPISILRSVK